MPYQIHWPHQAIIFEALSETLETRDLENFQAEEKLMTTLPVLVVFDLTGVRRMELDTLQRLGQMGEALAARGAKLMVIAREDLSQLIRSQKLEKALPCYVGTGPFFKEAEKQNLSASIKGPLLLDVSVQSLRETLKVYAKMDLTLGKVQKGTQNESSGFHREVVGVGMFTCNGKTGHLMISFQMQAYLQVVSAIMGHSYQQLDKIVSDWAGEFVNGMFGKLRTEMKKKGYLFKGGIPTVMTGSEIERFFEGRLTTQASLSLETVQCKGPFGECLIEVLLE